MEILDKIDSSQELPDASEGNRIVAYFIDLVLIAAVWVIPIIGPIIGLTYLFIRDAAPFLDGQSIGKRAMKIRVVTEDGQHLTSNWGPAIIRSIVFLIPFFNIVELIVLLTNERKQRLGDQWAKTRVVSVA